MIISLSGKIYSGKSLVGKIIQYYIAGSKDSSVFDLPLEEWDDDCVELSKISNFELKSFAQKLKQIVSILINCKTSDLENRSFKETALGEEWDVSKEMFNSNQNARDGKMTPRELMQILGTNCGRNIVHPNIWINALFSDYIAENEALPNWIITDSRFVNDDDRLKSLGALRIRIERPVTDSNQKVATHSSETALDHVTDFDETIINDGLVIQLMEKVKFILIKHKVIQLD
jgi:hypothetical protein